jgi:hypothetical protein
LERDEQPGRERSLVALDVAHSEMVEAELDHLIRRRDEKRRLSEGERLEEALWVDSARQHAAKLREAARVEWTLYHEHMSELHLRLSQEHAQTAERLCQEGESEATEGETA